MTEEQKEKYANFLNEVSEILGLSKPVDILRLCAATDEYFKPIEKHIADIEKENAELKADNDARKFAMAMSEKVEKQLREENAKLKEKLNQRSCHNCKRYNRACPNDGSCNHYSKWEGYENSQLTKAKELLRQWQQANICDATVLFAETENFFKENEQC